jgi:prepilin-type N-terminal cleavage/methylation domain-containing protein
MYIIKQYPTLRRRGFTLIELLVVIAIIGILAAMATWAVFGIVVGQERRNTQNTITVVNKILQEHWKVVIAEADADTPSPLVLSMAGGDPARAKVLWRKCRLVEAFPQTYAEIGNAANPPWIYSQGYIPAGQQRYNDYYQKQTGGLLAAKNPLSESGACLRLALSVVRGGATALADDKIKYAIYDTDGDGIPELIDSYENPKQALAFFRFAWNYNSTSNKVSMQGNATPGWTNLNPGFGKNARNAKYADPTDTEGTLVNPTWYFAPVNRATFEMWFHPVTNPFPLPANAQPPFTGCYVMPVIVSAGPTYDKVSNSRPFGFTLNAQGYFTGAFPAAMQPDMSVPIPTPNPNFETDNIYSYNLAAN